MTGRSTDTRISSRVGGIIAFLAAPVSSLVLFLILFNNVYDGKLILILLALFNGLILLFPNRKGRFRERISTAKAGSACALAVLVTALAIELLFPRVMPGEFVRVRELAQGPRYPASKDLRWFTVVFNNGDQRRYLPAAASPARTERFTTWHVPGARMEYYGYDPNEKFRYVNIIHWNSHGYFDHDYQYAKPPGVYRILVLGDSYVEAIQVPLTKSFHKLLEKSLNDAIPPTGSQRKRYQVIALGYSGTGQENNYKVLKDEAVLYHPDAVVMTLCTNDFCDDVPALRTERNLATGEITTLFRDLVRHGYAAGAFMLRRLNRMRRERYTVSPELLQWEAPPEPRIESAWDYTLSMLLKSRDFCRRKGIEFVLVYLGSELEVRYALDPEGTMAELAKITGGGSTPWDTARTVNRVTSFCREHRITLVSLLPDLIRAQKQTGKKVFGDHYTIFGNRVVAEALEAGLKASVLGRSFPGGPRTEDAGSSRK
jgi:lysophospholipase L1-like esterase